MTDKEKWLAARADVERIERVRANLVAHTDDEYRAAQEKMELIEDESGSVMGRCENCMDPIFDGEPMSGDSDACIWFCKICSPTYADVLADPGGYLDDQGETMTPEYAKQFVARHVEAGGSPTDSLAR